MQEILKLSKISKKFKKNQVLVDVDLVIGKKEIVTIIGPNGSGKTTLVKIILGLLKQDSGSRKTLNSLRVAYMPQKIFINNFLPITVNSFLKLCINDHKDFHKIVKELDIFTILTSQLYDISGGELQRVLLARCLLSSPDLLVLDEPMQGVDFKGQIWFYDLLAKLRNQMNISIIIVSHDIHMVMKASDKVLCINNKVCCYGSPSDVSNNPLYIEAFGKEALEIIGLYEHHHTK